MSMIAREKLARNKDAVIETGIDCSKDKVITKQEFKNSLDINSIMHKARNGQQIDPGALSFGRIPYYDDVSGMPSFQEAHQILMEAQQDFYRIPAEVRRRFDNDPTKLVDWLQDSSNREMAIKYGLIEPTVIESQAPPVATPGAEA